jgi:hypothetical protein
MGKLLSFVAGVAVALWILPDRSPDLSTWHVASYKAGRADALSLRAPVSWELEQTCVSLWASGQQLVEGRP